MMYSSFSIASHAFTSNQAYVMRLRDLVNDTSIKDPMKSMVNAMCMNLTDTNLSYNDERVNDRANA